MEAEIDAVFREYFRELTIAGQAFTIRMPVTVSCRSEVRSAIRSWMRWLLLRSFHPIAVMIAQ